MDSKTETLPQAVERPALDSGDLFGVPYVVDNLREWASEFRANQHPVTLTLFRAIQTLEKMDAAMAKDDREIVRLDAEIARYRVAISDYCEAQDDPDVAGDSKFLDRLRATLEPREKQPTPVWKKYGHPSEVSSPNNKVRDARAESGASPSVEASPEQQAQQARCSVAVGSAARDKWVADCIAYMVGLGIDADMARSEAEAWIEDNPEDVTECPKAIADDIMSYWVD